MKLFYVVHADIVTTVPQKEIFVAKTTDANASSDDVTPEKTKNSEDVSERARKEARKAPKRKKSGGGEQKVGRSKARKKSVEVDASREDEAEVKDTSTKDSVTQNTENESPKKDEIKKNDSSNIDEDLKIVGNEASDDLTEKQTEEGVSVKSVQPEERLHAEEIPARNQPDAQNEEAKRNVAVAQDTVKHCSDERRKTCDVPGEAEKGKPAETAVGCSEKTDTATGMQNELSKNCTEEEGKSNCSSENISLSTTIEPTENGKETDESSTAVQAEPTNTCSTQTGDVTQSVQPCHVAASSPTEQKKADSDNATTQNSDEVKSSKQTKSVEVQTDTNSAAPKVAPAAASRPQQQTYASPDSTSVTSAPPSSANISGSSFAKKYRLPSKSRSKPQKSRCRKKTNKPATDVISSSDPYRFDDGEQVSAAVPLASSKRESRDPMIESVVPAAKQRKVSTKSTSSSSGKKARNSSPQKSAGVKRVSAKPVQEDDVRSSTEPASKLPRISKQVPPLKLKIPSSLQVSAKPDYVMTAPLAASGRDNNSPPRILVRFSRERSKSSGNAQEERKPKQHNRRRTSSGVMRLPDVTKRKRRPSDVTVNAKPKVSATTDQNGASGSTSISRETPTQANKAKQRSDANKKQATARQKKRVSSTFSRPPHRPLTARERLDAIAELRNEMATHTPRSGLDLLSRASEKFSTLLEEKRKADAAATKAHASQAPPTSQKQTVAPVSAPVVTSSSAPPSSSVSRPPATPVSPLMTASALAPFLQLGMYMGPRPLLSAFPPMALYSINGLVMLGADAQRLQNPSSASTSNISVSNENTSKPSSDPVAPTTTQSVAAAQPPATPVTSAVTSTPSKSTSRGFISRKLESQIERIKQMTSRAAKSNTSSSVSDASASKQQSGVSQEKK